MNTPHWRGPLERALESHRGRPEARYVQLATVRADGRPAVRTVVFRGFLGASDALTFTTDRRSAKADQIALCPWAEACWYFIETREQFRLAGRLTLAGPKDPDPSLRAARRDAWARLSDAARLAFAWPAPGAPREASARSRPPPPDPRAPPPSFGLLVLAPDEVDHLDLRGDPHDRRIFTRDDAGLWSAREVNP